MYNYLKTQGLTLFNDQWPIIPIAKNRKAPPFKGWQHTVATQEDLENWQKSYYGVGILTKNFPAVDIDVLDDEASADILAWCKSELGATLVRVGNAPKSLIPFRIAEGGEPFTKVKSAVYEDMFGSVHAVEVLADGQQYVAYHTHPDTQKPYTWVNDKGLCDISPSDLPVLTVEDVAALMDYVVTVAEKYGWSVKRKPRNDSAVISPPSVGVAGADGMDDLVNLKSKLGLSADEVREKIMCLGSDDGDDYDQWVKVGMAIEHELGHTDEALNVWHEWSSQFDSYESEALDIKWHSFNMSGNGATVTMRSVLFAVSDQEFDRKEQDLERLLDVISKTTDRKTLTKSVPKEIAKVDLDSLMFNELVSAFQVQYKKITNTRLIIGEARKLCRPEIQRVKAAAESGEYPWANNWLYLSRDRKFFNTQTKVELTADAFDRVFDRELVSPDMIDEGIYSPQFHASHIAMNVCQVPVCESYMYAPQFDEVFALVDQPNVQYANSYRPMNVKTRERSEWTDEDRDCVTRIERVLSLVSYEDRDQLIFRQWLAFAFANLGTKKCTWSIFMQGAQGSGKTFWHELMSVVLGRNNTRSISAQEMLGNFSGWGQGSCFATVEEVKLHGSAKWDIMNKFKPYITNATVSVERKGRDAMDVLNTVTYLVLSQFKDGYPLEDSDRRIYPLFSKLQSKEDVDEFGVEVGLAWWSRTHDLLHSSAAAVRGWLAETDMAGFTHSKAPTSNSKGQMISLARSEEEMYIRELIDCDERPHINDKIVAARDVTNAAMEDGEDLNLATSALTRVLTSLGYTRLENRIKVEGVKIQLYIRCRELLSLCNKSKRAAYIEQLNTGKQLALSMAGADFDDDDFLN